MSRTSGAERVVLGRPRSEAEAQIWVDALRDEGIQAVYFPDRRSGVFGAGGDFLATYPVVVQAEDLDDARFVILGLGDDEQLTPIADGAGDASGGVSRLTAAGLVALVSIPVIMLLAAIVSWILG